MANIFELERLGRRLVTLRDRSQEGASSPRRWEKLVGPSLFSLAAALVFAVIGIDAGGVLTFVLVASMASVALGFGLGMTREWPEVGPLREHRILVGFATEVTLLLVNVTGVGTLVGVGVDAGKPFKVIACLAIYGSWLTFGMNVGALTKTSQS